jgi:hypothetical protein
MRSSKVLSAKRLGALKLKIKIKADETNPISILRAPGRIGVLETLGFQGLSLGNFCFFGSF